MNYNEYETAEALNLYAYNCSAVVWVSAIFPGRHPDYIAEKVDLAVRDGFWGFYGALDMNNRARLVDAALTRYGREARDRCTLAARAAR